MDWRAPASEPFYQATAARPAGVARRRHLSLRGRDVTTLEDDVLDAEGVEARGLTALGGEGALMAALGALLALSALPTLAHHSFAIYDMAQNIEFKGTVESLKFRNPHMAMTLARTNADGSKEIINFVEGAPANMLVRMGLDPAVIAPGEEITAIGAPRRDNPNAYFLKAIVLKDGTKFVSVGN